LVATTHDYFLVCPNGAQFNFNSESICNLVGGSLACSVTACDRRSFFDKVWRLGRHDLRAMTYPLASMQMRVAVIHAGMAGPLLNAGVPAERIVEIRNPIRPFVSGPRVMAERNREILFVGRLSHEKGPDLAALAASSAGLTIRFVGDGPLRPSLQAAFPNALFDGFLAREDIVKKARNARLLVLPSRWVEPFGLVTVEAMASGIPVVISKNALLADEIVASGSGFAVEPRDTASFAALLSTLATDDSRVQTASLHAIASSETIGLRLDAWISRHLDLYAEIIGTD
jgi:glycosyltransferase involved in cell wall biosynthesis